MKITFIKSAWSDGQRNRLIEIAGIFDALKPVLEACIMPGDKSEYIEFYFEDGSSLRITAASGGPDGSFLRAATQHPLVPEYQQAQDLIS